MQRQFLLKPILKGLPSRCGLLITVLLLSAFSQVALSQVVNTDDSGVGSLRQAIIDATAGDTITFNLAGCPCAITLTSGPLNVDKNLTIQGLGATQLTISGDNSSRVFRIQDSVTATLSGMTITEGQVTGGSDGAAIRNTGTLTVNQCIITNNHSDDDAGGISNDGNSSNLTVIETLISNNTAGEDGAGIDNDGDFSNLTVINSVISNNTADNNGGGISSQSEGTLTITQSTISNNTATDGGGINNESSTLTITQSTISNNQATAGDSEEESYDGGGIRNSNDESGPPMTIIQSTISGNSADDDGGGIYSYTDLEEITATLINTTISGNMAGGQGGGFYNYGGLSQLIHCTITNNTAPNGEGSGVATYGDYFTRTELTNCLVAGNTNTDLDRTDEGDGTDDPYFSFGGNIIGTSTPADNQLSFFNQPGDITGVTDPQLGPLANNGGPTLTHALLAGSPAINNGTTATSPIDELPITVDQRNMARDSQPDSGAFEFQGSTASLKFTGSGGSIDEADRFFHEMDGAIVRLRNSAPAGTTLNIRYNIPATQPLQGIQQVLLRLRYRDNIEATTARVRAILKSYHMTTGITKSLVTFDSQNWFYNSQFQVRQTACTPLVNSPTLKDDAIDFAKQVYFIDVELYKGTTVANPEVAVIQISSCVPEGSSTITSGVAAIQ